MSDKNILLVDDEQFILNTLARDLASEPFTLTLATGGEHAVCKIKKHFFDLVVTDILMEDIDGFQVLKAAKKKSGRTMVIMLTGYTDTTLVIDALRLGADDFLQKPCDSEELLFRIENCFARQPPGDTIGTDEAFLSVCAYCNKIQSKRAQHRATGDWYDMEEYFNMVQRMKISHGCCPECYTKQIAEVAGERVLSSFKPPA